MSFFVSCNFFILKSILSNTSIVTPVLFWLLFVWNIFFSLFTFKLFVFFITGESPVDSTELSHVMLSVLPSFVFWLESLSYISSNPLEGDILRLWDQEQQSAISTHAGPQHLEDKVLFAHPCSCKLCAGCSSNTCTAASMWLAVGGEQLLLWEELKLTKINHSLSSKFSLPNCRPSTDSRVPKLLHHTDSASAIVIWVRKQIPGPSYSAIFPEPFLLEIIFTKVFSLSIQTEIILHLALNKNNIKLVRHATESKQVEQSYVCTQSRHSSL